MKYIFDKSKFPCGGDNKFTGADALYLRALFCVSLAGEWDSSEIELLAEECGCAPSAALASLEYWQEAGYLTTTRCTRKTGRAASVKESGTSGATADGTVREAGDADARGEESPRKKPLRREYSLGERSGAYVARIIDEGKLAPLIDACQQISGKVYSTSETAVIAGLSDELCLDGEYILTLLKWCVQNGKKSLRYIEKTAFSLTDEGISTPDALNAYIARREASATAEGRLRKMFGISDRALTKNEEKCFARWCVDWGFSDGVIGLAYDLTVEATGKAAVNYADKILEEWHGAGVTDEAGAAEYTAKRRACRAAQSQSQSTSRNGNARAKAGETRGSFDADDFFSRALERSYGGKK